MNVFHHHLEAVEAASLWDLNLGREALRQVLQNDAVAGCKERKDMFDEVLLVLLQLLPVLGVLAQVDLIDRPEAGHLVLVHLPDVVILDRKNDKSVWVLFKKWLRLDLLRLRSINDADLTGGSDSLRWDDLAAGTAIARIVLVEHLR